MSLTKDRPDIGSNSAILFAMTVVWMVLIFLTPWSVGWRDSGEFLISPFFLDIPHPAGFPTYSLFSNVFSLLFVGPIAWRTHLFSAACSVFLMYQTYKLSLQLAANSGTSSRARFILALSTCSLILTEPFIRGALTAEVYSLNACFLVVILRLILSYRATTDVRWLYSAAFLGGLSLGNHVVCILAGVWIAISLISTSAMPKRCIIPGLLFCLFGLTVYAYLPLRAHAHPPLNTGDPSNLSRMYRQMTDARDVALRPGSPSATSSSGSAGRLTRLQDDLGRLLIAIPIPLAFCGGFAVLLGCIRSPLVYLPILGVIITTLGFFASWDLDPWLPAFACVIAVGGAAIAMTLSKVKFKFLPTSIAAFLILFGFGEFAFRAERDQLRGMVAPAHFQLPASTAKKMLSTVARNGVLVTEASWFITRYLQSIEGYRTDVTLLYVPTLLFPRYFVPARVLIGNESFVATESPDEPATSEPRTSNLISFISRTAPFTPIQIEPTSSLTELLKGLLNFENDGQMRVIRQVNASLSEQYVATRAAEIRSLLHTAKELPGTLGSDTINYATVIFGQTLITLKVAQNDKAACDFGRAVCSDDKTCPDDLLFSTELICRLGKVDDA